jgi:hypothetical protein
MGRPQKLLELADWGQTSADWGQTPADWGQITNELELADAFG